LQVNIRSGADVWYAAGGAGSGKAEFNTDPASGYGANQGNAGVANTGGGGSGTSSTGGGGAGGSGIVVVRWTYSE
jgi:hypothetical protein